MDPLDQLEVTAGLVEQESKTNMEDSEKKGRKEKRVSLVSEYPEIYDMLKGMIFHCQYSHDVM